MGADSFLAFYGIKLALDPDDEDTLDACGEGTDARCVAAKQAGLDSVSGRMTDGQDCFLFIGRRVAWLGLEHDSHVARSAEQLAATATDVQTRLQTAGFAQAPALHLQFIGQY